MKIRKELTPERFRCVIAGCPAVFKTDNKKLLIIGKVVDEGVARQIPEERIGPGEILIEVPLELLSEISFDD